MPKVILSGIAAGAAALTLAAGGAAATITIQIKSTGFSPSAVTINHGDTVIFRNVDTVDHQVVADSGSFASPILHAKQSWTATLNTPGTFRYHDALHPRLTGKIVVKGPLGTLKQSLDQRVQVKVSDGNVSFAAADASREANAMSGTLRSLVAGMVEGVSRGFEKRLSLVGVGYRAQAQGDKITLSLGFSHPVEHRMPAGVKVETPTQTEIVVKGADKQRVGQIAAEIRAFRPPEPYKGKGVRYSGETVILKETKKK